MGQACLVEDAEDPLDQGIASDYTVNSRSVRGGKRLTTCDSSDGMGHKSFSVSPEDDNPVNSSQPEHKIDKVDL